MTRTRWDRQDRSSTDSLSSGDDCKSRKRRSKVHSSKDIHTKPAQVSILLLLYIFGGIRLVSALFMVLPPTRLLLPVSRGGVVVRAESALQHQADSASVGLFSSDLASDSLNASVAENHLVNELPHSETQLKSIQSDAPALLLKSGPGTGKTYALASRIAYLIQSGSCRPEQMVVLSFTNRDAHILKERAVNMYTRNCKKDDANISSKQVMDRLWSGTIHSFASSIIRTYSRNIRVINSKEMRVRVDKCLCLLLEENHYGKRGGPNINKLKRIRILHRDSLGDLRQSRGILIHQICRCVDLWKEAGVLPPPAVGCLQRVPPHNLGDRTVRDNCVELSMRLGISQNVALLAMELFPQYQSLHESHGTADPSDLAAIATHILVSDNGALTAFRTKLKHIILDEYQDVSVTQHSLIRTIVRGVIDEEEALGNSAKQSVPPVLDRVRPSRPDATVCFQVPKLFCGGDSNQSIYGWRGAAPYISTEGFRRDYPQGIVVPLDISFRLTNEVWNTANSLIDPEGMEKQKVGSTGSTSWPHQDPQEQDETLRALLTKVSNDDEMCSPIRVQGLWDTRDEARFIASTIRNRFKSRMKRCAAALSRLVSSSTRHIQISRDPSDVAIMVRAGKQMELIKEALAVIGIPFVVCTSDEDTASLSRAHVQSNVKLMDMKPVILMTMHRAKGEEFDDVYLAGWTEGTFPHPTSISANRVDEERRLAFVALTRARQHVVITHSFVNRVLHIGPNLTSKYVTMQVSPSRFLYELVPAAATSSANTVHNAAVVKKGSTQQLPSIVWYRGKGVKECVAGRDVPGYFLKSYEVEPSFHPAEPSNQSAPEENANMTLHLYDTAEPGQEADLDTVSGRLTSDDNELLNVVITGLDDICERKQRRAKGRFKSIFREALRERFNLKRGNALVLKKDLETGVSVSYDVLLTMPRKQLKQKPLSRATAVELGLYLAYRLLSPFTE